MSIPKLMLLCGLPASGKSEYAKKLSLTYNAKIHSSDELRQELLGNISNQSQNELIFNELNKRIKSDLKQGKSVIADSCNINYKKRMEFLKQLKDVTCEKLCYLMATPYEECLEYNKNRERQVLEYVIERMYKNIYIPQYYEGWDYIEIIINSKKKHKSRELFFGINGLHDIYQENPHHTLTIGSHCMRTRENIFDIVNIYNNNNMNDPITGYCIHEAALFHDIGKKFCKEFNKEKGYCTYYQHHLVGAYDSIFYNSHYRTHEILEICNLIQWHMQLFQLKSEKSIQKFIDLVGKRTYNDLCLLHEADKLAK